MNAGSANAIVTSPGALRRQIKSGAFDRQTSGQAPGYLQGNLAILPERLACDFLRFCQFSIPSPARCSASARPAIPDLPTSRRRARHPRRRAALPRSSGTASPANASPTSIDVWRDDLVAFAIGCSFSFEDALQRAGIAVSAHRRRPQRADVLSPISRPMPPVPSAGRWWFPCGPFRRARRSAP